MILSPWAGLSDCPSLPTLLELSSLKNSEKQPKRPAGKAAFHMLSVNFRLIAQTSGLTSRGLEVRSEPILSSMSKVAPHRLLLTADVASAQALG